jgi:hypothetical protein
MVCGAAFDAALERALDVVRGVGCDAAAFVATNDSEVFPLTADRGIRF